MNVDITGIQPSSQLTLQLHMVEDPLPYGTSLAIATECGNGRRTMHRAEAKGDLQYNVTLNTEQVNKANKIMLCHVLSSKGLAAISYLDRWQLEHPSVMRRVSMYTGDYAQEIRTEARTLKTQPSRTAFQVDVSVLPEHGTVNDTDTNNLKAELKARICAYNAICKEENNNMKSLYNAVIEEYKMFKSNLHLPIVEVSLVRGQARYDVNEIDDAESAGTHCKLMVYDAVPQFLHLVPRSAYFAYACNANKQQCMGQKPESIEESCRKVMYDGVEMLQLLEDTSTNDHDRTYCAMTRITDNIIKEHVTMWNAKCTNGTAHGQRSKASIGSTLIDDLWTSLLTDCEKPTKTVVHMYRGFMPLTHGDYGPLSRYDPYVLDECFVRMGDSNKSRRSTSGVHYRKCSTDSYFNYDCETLSAKCAAQERSRAEIVSQVLNIPSDLQRQLIDEACADKRSFLNFILPITTLATFPVQALVQCETPLGCHVTHCRMSPGENWHACETTRDIYADGVALRQDCKSVIKQAIDVYKEKHPTCPINQTTDKLLSTVHGLYDNAMLRVQDCTVPEKTSNDFDFYRKFDSLYFWPRNETGLTRMVPTEDMYCETDDTFEDVISYAVKEPSRLLHCDIPDVTDYQNNVMQCFAKRMQFMCPSIR